MSEPPTTPMPPVPGMPTEPPVTVGAEGTSQKRRRVIGAVAGVALLAAAFVGGRLSVSDHASPTLADAVQLAQAGTLPCGSLTGSNSKALQKMCTPPAPKTPHIHKKKTSSSSSSSTSSSSQGSSSSSTSDSSAPSTTSTSS